ncbi:hypothetical protein FRB96_000114 [Tulasnella sp. 330]|nr:hypothetical protein FRB96_000114 [Tulasnella sp. 330]
MAARSLVLLSSLVLLAKAAAPVRPADPFADPKDDLYNPLRYIASNTLTSIALALYLPTTIALFFNIWKRGAKFMLCISIGAACYCVGLALRYALHKQPESKVYILLGRLARELRMGQYLIVKPEKLTKYFLCSDISTFLIQAAGGGMSTSLNLKSRDTGRKIFLAGLALQLVSFAFFTICFLVWNYKVRKNAPDVWRRDQVAGKRWYRDWRVIDASLTLSCVGILIRSFFRVVENSQGFQGHLTTTEFYFYCLDSLPLFIGIVGYVVFWPGSFISKDLPPSTSDEESHGSQDIEANELPGTTGGVADQGIPSLEGRTHRRGSQDPLEQTSEKYL